jgi:cobalt/nickel transport system permease protein
MSGQLSLRDFFQIEKSQYEGKAYGWSLWDPRLKLAMTVLAMALNVLFARAWLSGILFGLAAILILYSRCHWKLVLLFLLAPAWATLVLVLGMAFGFGVHPIYQMGPLKIYQEGLQMGLNAGLRVATDVAWAGVLVITTPFTAMLEALHWFRVPRVVVETLAYIYRYVFLLYDEFSAMSSSAQARGGYSRFKNTTSTSGLIAAQIFMRSYDRADRVWQAMQARGGEGDSHGL